MEPSPVLKPEAPVGEPFRTELLRIFGDPPRDLPERLADQLVKLERVKPPSRPRSIVGKLLRTLRLA